MLLLFISILSIILVLYFCGFDLVLVLVLFFLFFRVVRELFLHKALFNKFLFERYIYDFSFNRQICVKNVNSMKIWCRHLFHIDNSFITEKNMLSKRFDK